MHEDTFCGTYLIEHVSEHAIRIRSIRSTTALGIRCTASKHIGKRGEEVRRCIWCIRALFVIAGGVQVVVFFPSCGVRQNIVRICDSLTICVSKL